MKKICQLIKRIGVNRKSYKNRLIFSCSLSVLIPCIVFASYAFYQYYSIQEEAIWERSSNMMNDVLLSQENQLKNYMKLGSFFGQSEDIIHYFSKQGLSDEEYTNVFKSVEPNLNRIVNTNQDILDDLLVFTSNDRIIQEDKQIYGMDTLRGLPFGQAFFESGEKYCFAWDEEGSSYVFLQRFYHVNGVQMCVLAFVIPPEKMTAHNIPLSLNESYVLEQGNKILEMGQAENEDFRNDSGWIHGVQKELGAVFHLKIDFTSLYSLKTTVVQLYCLVILAIVLIILVISQLIKNMFGRLNTVIMSMKETELGEFHSRLQEEEGADEVSAIIHQFNQLLLQLESNAGKMLEEERRKKDAELLALQYQINPHFICNALHIVQLAVEEEGCFQISDAIAYFVSVLRYNISGNMDSTAAGEMENAREYIRFLRFCRKADIRVSEEIPERLMDTYMVKFVLQPVIENAVYHGYGREDTDIHIKFVLEEEDGFLHFQILNNGRQIEEGQLKTLNEKLKSPVSYVSDDRSQRIGLVNISYRLKLQYGEEASVWMTSDETYTAFHMRYREVRFQ